MGFNVLTHGHSLLEVGHSVFLLKDLKLLNAYKLTKKLLRIKVESP